jgi:hypothetical protein
MRADHFFDVSLRIIVIRSDGKLGKANHLELVFMDLNNILALLIKGKNERHRLFELKKKSNLALSYINGGNRYG